MAQAVRMGDWKAIRLKPGAPLELYNLKTDPGEKDNVPDGNAAVLARIEQYLKTARTVSRRHNTGTAGWAGKDDYVAARYQRRIESRRNLQRDVLPGTEMF